MRKCTICNNEVEIGYYAQDDYYCSDKCLSKDYTKEEWEMAHQENSDEFYWTIFEE